MPRTALAFALSAALVACRSNEPEVLEPGLSGNLVVDVFHVPEGETVWVDGDLTISATTAIAIDGRLVARDAAVLGVQDAPRIELQSALVIGVAGEVLGGRGADAQHTRGGNGSNVRLSAPLVVVHGRVVAGAGGEGGRSMPGGAGGDALIEGFFEGNGEPGHFELQGGRGGNGGYPGGDGGPSGGAVAAAPEELAPEIVEIRQRALAALAHLRAD